MSYDVIIIGAGPAGLTAARAAAARGRRTLVLEHNTEPGKKLLATGGGRCNFTNAHLTHEHYYSANPHFVKSAIARYSPEDATKMVASLGLHYAEEEGGKIFTTEGALALRDAMVAHTIEEGVVIDTKQEVLQVQRVKPSGFKITLENTNIYCQSLVIATGGKSYAKLGATDLGYGIAEEFELNLLPTRAALVPLLLSKKDLTDFADLSGLTTPASITTKLRRTTGSLLFTHRGISGPATLNASLYLDPSTETTITIDFFPHQDLQKQLHNNRKSKQEPGNLLSQFIPKRLSKTLCQLKGLTKPINQMTEAELISAATTLKTTTLTITGTEGYDNAEVTAGGLDTNEVSSKTFETNSIKGLYFIGEILDVTGELGGYNLHWAWASGNAAGQYV